MSSADNIDRLIAKLQMLKEKREQLLASDLVPKGAWIHYYSVHRTYPSGNTEEYPYAKWQASEPIFMKSRKGRQHDQAEEDVAGEIHETSPHWAGVEHYWAWHRPRGDSSQEIAQAKATT